MTPQEKEQEEFEFRLRMEREAEQEALATARPETDSAEKSPSFSDMPPVSFIDRTLGVQSVPDEPALSQAVAPIVPGEAYKRSVVESSPAMRLLRGIEAPAIKSLQLAGQIPGAENVPGLQSAVQYVNEIEPARKAGMEARYGDPNARDLAGMIGSMASSVPIGSGIYKALAPQAASVAGGLGRIAASATAGGAVAGLQPGSTTDDIATGAALGAIPSIAVEAGRGAVGLAKKINPQEIAINYIKERVGKKGLPEVADALKNAKPFVEGSPITAAEAVANISAGSPIQATQREIFQLPGGPSAKAGDILRQGIAARKAAVDQLRLDTAPLRNQAFSGAAAQGGVKVNGLLKKLTDIETAPENVGKQQLKSFIGDVRGQIVDLKDKNWRVPVEAVDNIRRFELNAKLDAMKAANPKLSTKDTARLILQIKDALDDAVEKSGGVGYKKYLEDYSKGMADITKDLESKKMMYKPLAKTKSGNIGNVAQDAVAVDTPNFLSRPMMIARFIPRLAAAQNQPKVQASLADLLANPVSLGNAIDSIRQQQVRQGILQSIMQQYGPAITGTFGGRQQ